MTALPLLTRPPFVRRALLGMSQGVRRLIGALEADTLENLVGEAKKEGSLRFRRTSVKG